MAPFINLAASLLPESMTGVGGMPMPVYAKSTPANKTKPEKTIEIHCLY